MSPSWGKGDMAHAHRGSLGVKKEGVPPHNRWCHTPPPPKASGLESILDKQLCTHVGEGPRAGQAWKKKPDNWPKVNKEQRPGRTALYK